MNYKQDMATAPAYRIPGRTDEKLTFQVEMGTNLEQRAVKLLQL